ncbi:hypothetical protein SFC65_20440 [Priestia filamentosa]|uniref:hypothetical protein n=1 Tax=Priestia filamentosa TaxID=1402861 RepID=UPI0039829AC3
MDIKKAMEDLIVTEEEKNEFFKQNFDMYSKDIPNEMPGFKRNTLDFPDFQSSNVPSRIKTGLYTQRNVWFRIVEVDQPFH